MEENEIRSAYEIAMAKYGKLDEEDASLDDARKAAIREIRTECEAKIAERRIMTEAERERLARERTGEAMEKIDRLRREFADAVEALQSERDRKIEEVRAGRGQSGQS